MPSFYGRPKRRRQVSVGVVPGDLDAVANSIISATGSVIGSGQSFLRTGWFGAQGVAGSGGDIGLGADNSQTRPYRAHHFNPHAEGLTNLNPVLDRAQSLDIFLIVMIAGSAVNYGGGAANGATFILADYQAMIDRIATSTNSGCVRLSTMLRNRQALVYFGDEPNAPTWGPAQAGWSPTLWNQAARECKNRWPGCLTAGRLAPTVHQSGWGPYPGMTAAQCNAIDYGFLQYSAREKRFGRGAQAAIDFEEAGANALNMGVCCSINVTNAGLRTTLDGVPGCWDYGNNGSSGIVIGNPATTVDLVDGHTFIEDEKVICANSVTHVSAAQNLLSSPAQIVRTLEVWKNNPRIPFVIYWMKPDVSVGDSLILNPYFFRPDFVLAYQQAQTFADSRTSYTGLRTPKP